MPVQRPTPPADDRWTRGFYRRREGATCRNSMVSSASHLKIGPQWFDQCLVWVCSDLSVSPETFLGLALFVVGEATSLTFRKLH